MSSFISVILYLVLAPFVGGLLEGADRIITARMQGRVGPPLLQPFYDLGKLFSKTNDNFLVMCLKIYIYIYIIKLSPVLFLIVHFIYR